MSAPPGPGHPAGSHRPDVFEDETGRADRRVAVGPSEVRVVDGDAEVDPHGVAIGAIDHDHTVACSRGVDASVVFDESGG